MCSSSETLQHFLSNQLMFLLLSYRLLLESILQISLSKKQSVLFSHFQPYCPLILLTFQVKKILICYLMTMFLTIHNLLINTAQYSLHLYQRQKDMNLLFMEIWPIEIHCQLSYKQLFLLFWNMWPEIMMPVLLLFHKDSHWQTQIKQAKKQEWAQLLLFFSRLLLL